MSSPPKTRRWFRFGLRSILVVMLVVSVLLAWFARPIMRSRKERAVVAKIKAAGGTVAYDYQITENSFIDRSIDAPGFFLTRSLLGDDIYASVSVVDFDTPTSTDSAINASSRQEVLAELYQLEKLKSVALSGSEFDDDSAVALAAVPSLEHLRLADTSISPEGFRRLGEIDSLTHLTLYGSYVTDEHLAELHRLPQLEWLQVIRTSVTDAGIESLGSVISLKSLDLWEAMQVTDQGLKGLSSLENLERLHLVQTAVQGDSLSALADLKELKLVTLAYHPITDSQLLHLDGCSKMEYLQFDGTHVTDAGISVVDSMPHLQYLGLESTQITDDGLRHISGLQQLERLDLRNVDVTDAGLIHLYKLHKLKNLELEADSGISEEGIQALKAQLPECEISTWKTWPDGTISSVGVY